MSSLMKKEITKISVFVPYQYEPNENTVGYRPLDSVNQLNDLSGNNLNFYDFQNNKISFTDNYVSFDESGGYLYCPNYISNAMNCTLNLWIYKPATGSHIFVQKRTDGYSGGYDFIYTGTMLGFGDVTYNIDLSQQNWINICFIQYYDSGLKEKLYINGEKVATANSGRTGGTNMYFWFGKSMNYDEGYLAPTCRMSNIIWERDSNRTDEKVLEHFNGTKDGYGF